MLARWAVGSGQWSVGSGQWSVVSGQKVQSSIPDCPITPSLIDPSPLTKNALYPRGRKGLFRGTTSFRQQYTGALIPDHHPGFAVTGSPVLFYSLACEISSAFLPDDFSRVLNCGGSQPTTSFSASEPWGLLLLALLCGCYILIINEEQQKCQTRSEI
jgi:hypothetical protein